MADGDDEHSLIYVGGDDGALLGEVGGAAYDVVAAVMDGCNPPFLHVDDVADGNRISATNTLKAEVSFHLTGNRSTIIKKNRVPETGVFYYKASHTLPLILSLFPLSSLR